MFMFNIGAFFLRKIKIIGMITWLWVIDILSQRKICLILSERITIKYGCALRMKNLPNK